MRIPTFSRPGTADSPTADERPTAVTTKPGERPTAVTTKPEDRPAVTPRRDDTKTTTTIPPVRTERERAAAVTERERATAVTDRPAAPPTPVADRKPRASLLATVSLVLAVAGALLVLSGPLIGYGIGVASAALILSVTGLYATRKRHVAGKTDALVAMVLAIAAIVVGVLALTGQLYWLGTDTNSATTVREWLDAQFENRI
ncbi:MULTISPECIES: DUF4190 domain-containing protein [Actinoplanes]|uniref:DUF4190 domain-containing protein n=1 Tax=Actinoplanes TaxID=1865 RepID=UPI000697A9B0|nr:MULTISPECIES: DUF4190 domain-containing protein [Actinoplanes]GLY03536.1 hypothetical protein Acsp01_39150 [Actinoplanes sp. NBRC 101535]